VVGSMSGAVTGDPPSSPSSIMNDLVLSVHVCCLVVRSTVGGIRSCYSALVLSIYICKNTSVVSSVRAYHVQELSWRSDNQPPTLSVAPHAIDTILPSGHLLERLEILDLIQR